MATPLPVVIERPLSWCRGKEQTPAGSWFLLQRMTSLRGPHTVHYRKPAPICISPSSLWAPRRSWGERAQKLGGKQNNKWNAQKIVGRFRENLTNIDWTSWRGIYNNVWPIMRKLCIKCAVGTGHSLIAYMSTMTSSLKFRFWYPWLFNKWYGIDHITEINCNYADNDNLK